MKCPLLSIGIHSVDCLGKDCGLGWDKETNQCVFLAFERIAKALEKIASRMPKDVTPLGLTKKVN